MGALCVDDPIQGETAMMRSVNDLRGYAIRATDPSDKAMAKQPA